MIENRIDSHHISQGGASTLLMTLILITLSTLIVIFAANYGMMQSKSITNLQRHEQAYDAAQAGLEYGINYLSKNSATILASPVSGLVTYTDATVTNVSLPNGSKFSVTFNNPTANNYNLIKISSTGISDDSTATKTISQLVQFGSLLLTVPTKTIMSLGSVTLSNSVQISNNSYNSNIQTGSSLTINNLATTATASGTSSSSGNFKSDVSQNDAALTGKSSSDFFASYFGVSAATVKKNIGTYYSNDGDKDYSSLLNGAQGTSIWIDQTSGTATISGSSIIGSSTNPVVLIIKGNTVISSSAIIFGFVYLDNSLTAQINNSSTIVGSLASTGPLNMAGSARVMYSASTLTNLQNQSSMKYFSKIPGSWKDFQ